MSNRILPIESAAGVHPDSVAFDDGKVQVTYAELISAVADSPLMATGLAFGQHVAWCPLNDITSFLTFWAIQRLGCVACPISHRFPEDTRREIIARIGAIWLPDLLDGVSNEHLPRRQRHTHATATAQHGSPSTLILSSGSTGVPKAIIHSMAAHVASAAGAATNMPLKPGDRWLWSLPLFHVSGLSILIRCAVAGATVTGIPAESSLDADLLADMQVTHLSVVSTQLRNLLNRSEFPAPGLKSVLLGGSSVDPRLVTEARERGIDVRTTYGLTEMGSQVTTSRVDGDPAASGCILPHRQLKISDNGEILVQGNPLCLGYFEDGHLRSVADKEGWFHTGDLGVLNASGQLSVTGRIDNMFISGGENIHPEYIERAMLSSFDIKRVAVVPKRDAKFGERPVAFVDGTLPGDWDKVLARRLSRFEIPVEIRPWPAVADGPLKPDRQYLKQLAGQLTDLQ